MLIEKIKARAQFFQRGHIIPTRILRCSKRRYQHLIRFGSDVWALPMPKGYMLLSDMAVDANTSAIRIERGLPKSIQWVLEGSPYHKDGRTVWVGNHRLTETEFEESIRKAIIEMS